jgi:hypothetical protein
MPPLLFLPPRAAALLSALIVLAIAVFLQVFYFASTPCHSVESLWLPLLINNKDDVTNSNNSSTMISINACDCFSDTYEQARQRFLHACRNLPEAQLDSILVYHNQTSSNKERYYMDICVLPGSTSSPTAGLVIHSSGVHGVEGFAGSAIQIALLETILKVNQTPRPTVILIHAVNPYGMAHYRRVNEDNVDLNRNAMTEAELEELSKSHVNHHNKKIYQQFDTTLFNPTTAPTLWNSYIGFLPKVIWQLYKHGMLALKTAMVGGQYYQPRGIFYGGNNTLQASTKLLEQWLTRYYYSPERDNESRIDGVTTWIDVHTGLGVSGEDTLLPGSFTSMNYGTEDYAHQLQQWFPNSHSVLEESNSVAHGYNHVKGLYGSYFYNSSQCSLLRDHPKSLFLVQEFGTIPSILVGHALMTENAAFHYSSQPLEWAKRTMLPAFYLQRPEWRRQLLQQGVRVALQSMNRTIAYSENKGNIQEALE